MATQMIATQSMAAKAQQLLSERARWAAGTRKSDGRAFWLMPSSDGTTAYYVAQDGDACSCKSGFYRGICGHIVAAREAAHEDSLENGLDDDPDRNHLSNDGVYAELAALELAAAGADTYARSMGRED